MAPAVKGIFYNCFSVITAPVKLAGKPVKPKPKEVCRLEFNLHFNPVAKPQTMRSGAGSDQTVYFHCERLMPLLEE